MNKLPTGVSPNRVATIRFDVVVVGSGAAGSTCALAAAARGLRVAVVAKGASTDTNTSWARGGVAAVLADDDSVEQHVADTLVCGGVLCDEDVVQTVISGGPDAIVKPDRLHLDEKADIHATASFTPLATRLAPLYSKHCGAALHRLIASRCSVTPLHWMY
jgi:choline dehydrogenase-like flavoprotein